MLSLRKLSSHSIRLLAVVLALVFAVSAAIPALATPPLQNTVTVTFWQFDTTQFIIDAWNAAIAEFEKANPGITVKMEIVPWADQHQKLITGLTTGALPDVSMLGNNVVAEFQALGALEPLTTYFDAWSKEIGSDITKDIWPGDELYYNLKGDWWGSPVAEETRSLYYRKDLLTKAGFSTPPDTWADVEKYALALTQGDVYGFGIPGGIEYATVQTFMSVYLSYGAKFLNQDGKCGFDTQEFRDALTYYTNLYVKDKVTPPDTPKYGNQQLEELFKNGKLAMFVDGPWLWAQLTDAKVDFLKDVGIAMIPAGPKGRFGFLGGWPLVLWKSSQHKDEAFKWIKFATDPKGYLGKLVATAGTLPGRKSIVNEAPWDTEPLNIFAKQLEIAYPYQYPDAEIPQMGTLEVDAVQTPVQNVMLGQASVADATTALCTRIDSVLSR